MQRTVTGTLAGLVATAICAAALLPLRSSVSLATVGLVLVVPVVIGVSTGGVVAGIVSVAAGFLVYDFLFIRPYYTLSVGAAQNWTALVVYVAVVLVVARVVSRLQEARGEAQRRAGAAQRLLELSELLVTEAAPDQTVKSTVEAIRSVLGSSGVTLLVPGPTGLEVRATSGEPPSEGDLADLRSGAGSPVAIGLSRRGPSSIRAVPLVSSGRPVGVLALRDSPGAIVDPDLLQTFVNQAALAIERSELRDQAVKTQILEESDRMRRALLSAVSHDLRTPLATMKIAATSLLDSERELDEGSRRELYELLDGQADRLSRLVTGLLDMNRYSSGALQLKREVFSVTEVIDEAVSALGYGAGDTKVDVMVADSTPPVNADRLLIAQVLVNLLDNAFRHHPPGQPVTVSARPLAESVVVVSVEDRGPGVAEDERDAVFESFFRSGSGGRAGLGLWICRTFVEAHGERLWVENGDPGARFCFTLAAAGKDGE